MLRHLFNGETYSDVSVNEYNNKENNTIAQLYVYHEKVLVESDPCVFVLFVFFFFQSLKLYNFPITKFFKQIHQQRYDVVRCLVPALKCHEHNKFFVC